MVDPTHDDESGKHHHHGAVGRDAVATRVFLQPIAPPAILGLWGFSIAMFIVGAYFAGWFGGDRSLIYIAPFAFFAGGFLQILACIWAFSARDAFSTVAWGIWGSFFLAFGVLWFFITIGLIPPIPYGHVSEFAIWFIPLAVLSFLLMGAAILENTGLALIFFMTAVGSVLLAAGFFTHDAGDNRDNEDHNHNLKLRQAGGYFFVISAAFAMYTGLWMLLSFMSGRDLLYMHRTKWAEKRPRIHGGENEPGVKKCM